MMLRFLGFVDDDGARVEFLNLRKNKSRVLGF